MRTEACLTVTNKLRIKQVLPEHNKNSKNVLQKCHFLVNPNCGLEKPYAFAHGFFCCSHELSLSACGGEKLNNNHGLECCQAQEWETCQGGERSCRSIQRKSFKNFTK